MRHAERNSRRDPKRDVRLLAKAAKHAIKAATKSEDAGDARRGARRDAILEVARQVFSEEGYAAASMSSIAARLGGSKGTLYNYFKNKDALFEAYIAYACGKWREWIFDLPHGGATGVERLLADIGERFLTHIYSDDAIRLFQLVTAEAKRAPELARTFYETGPSAGLARVTAVLEAAKEAGQIDPPDCGVAAEQFFALLRGQTYFRYSLNLIPRPSPLEIRTEVERSAATLVAAYRAPQKG